MSARRGSLMIPLLLCACTYAPEEARVTIEQVTGIPDSYRAIVVLRHERVRRPTGLSAFPDGGTWRYAERGASEYLVDARSLDVRRLAYQVASDEVWESFQARVVGVDGDSVAFLRTTGCPRGGECYPGLDRALAYRLPFEGEAAAIDEVPESASLPGRTVAREREETRYVRFGTNADTVTARFEEGGSSRPLFRALPDGSLIPVTGGSGPR